MFQRYIRWKSKLLPKSDTCFRLCLCVSNSWQKSRVTMVVCLRVPSLLLSWNDAVFVYIKARSISCRIFPRSHDSVCLIKYCVHSTSTSREEIRSDTFRELYSRCAQCGIGPHDLFQQSSCSGVRSQPLLTCYVSSGRKVEMKEQ